MSLEKQWARQPQNNFLNQYQNQNQTQNHQSHFQQSQKQFQHQGQNQDQFPNQDQFQNQNQSQNQFHNQFQNQFENQFQNQNQFLAQPFRLNMRTDLSTPLHPFTEHQELHREDHHQLAFDEQFDRLEQELAQAETQAETHNELSDMDKEEFARTAGKVKETMLVDNPERSEETTQKFQQSNFLKLMSSIHERSVEISDEGDKLVDRSGQDIRETTEARDERTQSPDYHAAMHDTQPVQMSSNQLNLQPNSQLNSQLNSQNIQSRLPDPLAHIKDGALPEFLDPLQAAKIVSGNQVKTGDWMPTDDHWLDMTTKQNSIVSQEWQEMYDDYRHDDDAH